ncbi:hypothetical protein V6N11_004160 [Hibiscus sabdariffa]|uniref:RNase H type-1 domain-containing protein n=1 Tax=Hibiscus sabdariffa TaxID=183260 RepID=A0ABR2SGC0_9ROSI
MAFFSVYWSIWLSRNNRVFNNICLSEDQLFEASLLRTFRWCQCSWPEQFFSESYFLANPQLVTCKVEQRRVRPRCRLPPLVKLCCSKWMGLPGAVLVWPGLEACFAIQVVKFSRSLGIMDATTAEILAIKEAGLICKDNFKLASKKIVIVSDTCLVCNWILAPQTTPLALKAEIMEVWNLCKSFGWEVESIDRELNIEADSLAKNGIG